MCRAEPVFPCNCKAVSPVQMGLFEVSGCSDLSVTDETIVVQENSEPRPRFWRSAAGVHADYQGVDG